MALSPKVARATRMMLGLSRSALAKRAGLAPSCLQAFEESAVHTRPETVEKIERVLFAPSTKTKDFHE